MLPESIQKHRYSKEALRTTLQLCAAAIGACILAVGLVSTRRTAAELRNAQSAEHIQNARARLARASERLDLIDRYQDRYRQLVHEGVTVRFDRSVAGDWFDLAMRNIHAAEIDDYTIGKDAPYSGPETADLTAFRVVAHRLEFHAAAADEDDFAELMGALEKRVPGTSAQEGCSLARNVQSTESARQLIVNCAVVWYEFTSSDGEPSAALAGAN